MIYTILSTIVGLSCLAITSQLGWLYFNFISKSLDINFDDDDNLPFWMKSFLGTFWLAASIFICAMLIYLARRLGYAILGF